MRVSFAVVLCLLPLAYAGIPEVDEKIEAEAHRLWEKYCEGQGDTTKSEGGGPVEKNMYVYCKQSKATTEVPVEHEATFPPDGRADDEADNIVVFIRPPAVQYNHALTVKGQPAKAPKTVIYVKPVEYQHKVVNLRDDTDRAKSQKPTVYYLKKNHGAASSGLRIPPASEAEIDSAGITPNAPTDYPGATPHPSTTGYVYTPPTTNGNGHHVHDIDAQAIRSHDGNIHSGNSNGNNAHVTVDLTAPAPHGEGYGYSHPQQNQQQQHTQDRRRLNKVPYNRYRS